jgi:hypothetical protein
MHPQIVGLSGPSAGSVIPVDEVGVRLSDEFVARLHDGRAVAYIGVGKAGRPRCLLDHNAQIRTGGWDYRFEHFEIDPARVTGMFPEIKPCDPTQSEDVQKYFIDLICRRFSPRLRVAIIPGDGRTGRATLHPEAFPFFADFEIIDQTQREFMPAHYDQARNILCVKLSNDDRCLGVLYVQGLESTLFSREDRIEITRIASYISTFFASFRPPRRKDPRLVVLSGPDEGKVIPLAANPVEFGPAGLDDPEPMYRIEMTDRGPVLRTDPKTMERRQKHILALIFQKIPAATKAAVCMAEGNRTGEFSSIRYPGVFEIDAEVLYRAFFWKLGMASNEEGTICAAAIMDPNDPLLAQENRLGVLYMESRNDADPDPSQLMTLEDIAFFAWEYLSIPSVNGSESASSA